MSNRDIVLIKTIIDTIDEINEYIQKFGCKDFKTFNQQGIVKRATTMCMISISEMVDALTNEFKAENPQINYKSFKTLRNIAAHKYGAVNFEIVWEIITKNLPEFRKKLSEILNT